MEKRGAVWRITVLGDHANEQRCYDEQPLEEEQKLNWKRKQMHVIQRARMSAQLQIDPGTGDVR